MTTNEKKQIAELEKALKDLLDAWDTTCRAVHWDPNHLKEAIRARQILLNRAWYKK